MMNIKQVYAHHLSNHFRLNYTESQVNDIINTIEGNLEQLDYDVNTDVIQLETPLLMSWLSMEWNEYKKLIKSSYPYLKWAPTDDGRTVVEVNLTMKNAIKKIN